MRRHTAAFFSWVNALATVFIFFVMWALSNMAISLDFLNIVDKVLDEFNIADIVFSHRKDTAVDSSIVIVNIGDLDRFGIAQQISNINQHSPKVIGIDTFFKTEKDSTVDNPLMEAFKNTENLILGSKVISPRLQADSTSIVWDTLQLSHPKFVQFAETGFVNTITDGASQFEKWSEAAVIEKLADKRLDRTTELCFAAKIVEKYDSLKAKKFLRRSQQPDDLSWKEKFENFVFDRTKGYEIINFRRNQDKYPVLSEVEVLENNFDPNLVKGKIVLLGYLGGEGTLPYWDDDKYYSPMNNKLVGRSTPDMYGVVGHANLVSMILDEDSIDEVASHVTNVLAILIAYLNIAIFHKIMSSKALETWYDGISKTIQLIELLLLGYLAIHLLEQHNIKIDLSVTALAVLFSGDLLQIFNDLVLINIDRFKHIKFAKGGQRRR